MLETMDTWLVYRVVRRYQIILLNNGGVVGVNNMPTVIMQSHPGWGSNSRPLDLKSDDLLLSQHATSVLDT